MSVYRDLVRHSAVYGIGHIASRLASVLLLPLYTTFLTPADYGVIAILDLTTAILAMLAAGGIVGAVIRIGADPPHVRERHALWTTGMILLAAVSIPQLILAWLFRGPLAAVTFGPEVASGAHYYELAIYALVFNIFVHYASAYLRVLRRSGLFVIINLAMLVARIALNVWTIAFLGMGVLGFLYSSLVVGACQALLLFWLLFPGRPFQVIWSAFPQLWSYGGPLVLTGLAVLFMHQADRYLLVWILGDMSQVGIYSLAFNLVFGVTMLVSIPFNQIWGPMVFEVHHLPERREIITRVFKYFVLGFFLALLALALLSEPVVSLLSSEQYREAADLIPVLCLALLLFPLYQFLSLPATIHKRTRVVAMVSCAAALVKVAAGAVLIRALGPLGAAISGIVTYAFLSLGGHLRYRRIEDLGFPLRFIGYCLALGFVLVALERGLFASTTSLWFQILWGGVCWFAGLALVLAGPARALLTRGSSFWKGGTIESTTSPRRETARVSHDRQGSHQEPP